MKLTGRNKLNAFEAKSVTGEGNQRVNHLHLGDVCLQTSNGILITSSLTAHAILHVSHLAQQGFVLNGSKDGKVQLEQNEQKKSVE